MSLRSTNTQMNRCLPVLRCQPVGTAHAAHAAVIESRWRSRAWQLLPGQFTFMNRFSIDHILPGLRQLRAYRREWLRSDLAAGVSVAAVAVPTAIAYAQLIGFEPVVGLYAAILPLVAYALLGTSRQLIVNPDAATCAVFAASVIPLAGGDAALLASLSVALSVLTGLICIAAGIFRLGFVADFLAKPIL